MKERDLATVNVVEVAPFRVARWEESPEGRVVLVRVRPERGPGAARRWTTYLLGTRRIRLDEVGSAAWRLVDGHRTVADLATELRAHFGERIEPAEERLGHWVRVLRREGLVGYAGIDPAPPR